MRRTPLVFAFLLASAVAGAAPVGPRGARWLPVDVLRQAQGLPQNTVMSIRQTHDGYLWLGTKGGVARFDGLRFTTWDDRDRTKLRENEVWALTEGDDGSLWMGTFGGGVSRFKDGRFTVLTTRDGLVNDYVTDLCTDRSGAIWIATDGGVSRYREGRFTSYTVAEGLAHVAARSLLCDADGSVWIGTASGRISRYEKGTMRPADIPGVTPGAEVRWLLRDRGRGLWVATTDGLLLKQDGPVQRFTVANGLPSNWTLVVHEDPKGNIWVGAEGGLARYIPGTTSFESLGADVTGIQTVKSIFGDREGNLWVGGLIDGMVRLRETLFVTYGVADGLADPYVTTVFETHDGDIWLGTAKGLERLRGGKITTYTMADPRASHRITALAEDPSGQLWIGTNEGLYRMTGGRVLPVRNEALPTMNVRVIHCDRDGALWIGTQYDGLVQYHEGRFTRFTTKEGLSDDAVRALAQEFDGTLWIGTKKGLTRLRDGAFTVFSDRDGLASAGVESLYVDRENALWIATRQGVNRLKNDRFVTLAARDGLHATFVYCFVEDDEGYVWMNSSKGIFRVRKRDLDDFADGRARTVSSVAYGVEHGLTSTVGVVSHFPVAYRAHDGRVWFATLRGASVVDPRKLSVNRIAPPVQIEGVSINARPFTPGPHIGAPPGPGDLVFTYTGLSLLAPDKVAFKYKLVGYDPDWIDAGDRRVAYYTNIPPGPYKFQVVARNADFVWNNEGASIDIDLAPRVHQTVGFRVAGALTVALAFVVIHFLRLERLRRRERELSTRVKEALTQLKVLRGLLPICASCKKVRDDTGYWSQIETYIHERSEAEFSHSICPECMERLYPEFMEEEVTENEN